MVLVCLDGQGSAFLNSFRSAGAGGLEETWDEIQREGRVGQPYGRVPPPQQLHQPALDGIFLEFWDCLDYYFVFCILKVR